MLPIIPSRDHIVFRPIPRDGEMPTEDPPPESTSKLLSDDDHSFYKEEEKMLKEFDFYHGFIPREDLPYLVREDGDYLLRLSELDNSSTEHKIKREIVLSLYVDAEGNQSVIQEVQEGGGGGGGQSKARSKLRNVIIRRVQKNKYMLEVDKHFDSFRELITHYQNNYGILNKARFILKNPVKLQKWELLHDDLKLGKQLGEGAYGEVRQGVWQRKKNKTKDVAVKLTKGSSDLCKAKIKEMMREARLMRNLRHKNIVRIHGVAVLEQPLYIVLELVRGGALNSYLTKNKCSMEEKMSMCLGAARGVEHLHKNGVIHRDLAARNCLYQEKERLVKISDFGLSRQAKEYKIKTAVKLPIKWLAPETINSFVFTSKTDIYSYGVMVHEIFADGAEPWEKFTNTEVKKAVTEGQKLPLWEAPERVRKFVKEKIFAKDPQDRSTMTDIVRFFEVLLDPSKTPAEVRSDRQPPEELKDSSQEKLKETETTKSVLSKTKDVPTSTSSAVLNSVVSTRKAEAYGPTSRKW